MTYYADGDYSFDEPDTFNLPANCNPTDLVSGTFNGDPYPDLAVTCSGFSPNHIRIYRGRLVGTGDYLHRRWLVVNHGGELDTDATARPNTLTYINALAADPSAWSYEYEIPVGTTNGNMTGSAILSSDGQRAYMAREAGEDPVGTVVFDMRPGIPGGKRLMGAAGQDVGVSQLAMAQDPITETYKLYQSNVDDCLTSIELGVWVMPEPLLLPFNPFRLVQDVPGGTGTYAFPQRPYALLGPKVSSDGKKLVAVRMDDVNQDSLLDEHDFASMEIVTMEMGPSETYFTGGEETRLTDNTEYGILDTIPVWSPAKVNVGGQMKYKILFSSTRKCDDLDTECCNDQGDPYCLQPDDDGDLFVMNEDGSGVVNLTDTDAQGEFDADWGIGEDENWYVVFNRSPIVDSQTARCSPLNPGGEDPEHPECNPYYTTIWRAKYEVISGRPTLTNFTQLTDLYENDPEGYQNSRADKQELFGDADPEIDPLGRWIVFNRHAEDILIKYLVGDPEEPTVIETHVVDTDLFVIPLDATGPDPDQEDDITGADDVVVDCEEDEWVHQECLVLTDRIAAWAPSATADPYWDKIAFTSESNDPKHDYDLSIVEVEGTGGGHLGKTSRVKIHEGQNGVVDGNRDTSPFWFPNWNGMDDDPALIFDRSALSGGGGEQELFEHQLKRY